MEEINPTFYFVTLVDDEISVFRTGFNFLGAEVRVVVEEEEEVVIKVLHPMQNQPPNSYVDLNDIRFTVVGVYPRVYLMGKNRLGERDVVGGQMYNEIENLWFPLPPPLVHRDWPLLVNVSVPQYAYGAVIALPYLFEDKDEDFGEIYYPLKQPFYVSINKPINVPTSKITLCAASAKFLYCALEYDQDSIHCYSFVTRLWNTIRVYAPCSGWGRGQASIYHDEKLWTFSDGNFYFYCLEDNERHYGEVQFVPEMLCTAGEVIVTDPSIFRVGTFFYVVWLSEELSDQLLVTVWKFKIESSIKNDALDVRMVKNSSRFYKFSLHGASTSFKVACLQISKKQTPKPYIKTYINTLSRTPNSADYVQLLKHTGSCPSDEVTFSGEGHPPNLYSVDDLPKLVVQNLQEQPIVMSMDFHPTLPTILLVGTSFGVITIWEVASSSVIEEMTFELSDFSSWGMPSQKRVRVNCCVWGPDGSIFGIAFSRCYFHTYSFGTTGEVRHQLRIDAHIGVVNDIAFAYSGSNVCVVTCGDDRKVKVWDAASGHILYVFEGHEASVHSVCPHDTEGVQFIASSAADGKIKVCKLDCLGSGVDYDAGTLGLTRMLQSAGGSRLFSCGTGIDGQSRLLEWNKRDGIVERTYIGLRNQSAGLVHFDIAKSRFLAAGDAHLIKFWDVDKLYRIASSNAGGGLSACAKLKFNRDGSLLAVVTNENGIKILGNADGQRLISMAEQWDSEVSESPCVPINVRDVATTKNVLLSQDITSDSDVPPSSMADVEKELGS